MSFWRKISPTGAARDFVTEFRRPNPYRWRIVLVSLVATVSLFSLMVPEGAEGPPPRPEVTYITTFAADRTDAEIIASNIENQKRKDAIIAERKARDERIRDIYRTLGKVSGMDVEKIEREAAADKAADEARREAAREAGDRASAVE
ncbi:MAG: hypothetical protein KDE63_02940 [Novosphingobium sp.]|nr:hypothetical protein [Novosphingobium sp.]